MKKDRIHIIKIQGYVKRVKRIYELIKDLEAEEIIEINDSYALTQFLVNIHSLFACVTSDAIAIKQIEMGIRALDTCRNISAHDYDSLDWNRVKQLCKKLISERTEELLNECYEIAKWEEEQEKDYTFPTPPSS